MGSRWPVLLTASPRQLDHEIWWNTLGKEQDKTRGRA